MVIARDFVVLAKEFVLLFLVNEQPDEKKVALAGVYCKVLL